MEKHVVKVRAEDNFLLSAAVCVLAWIAHLIEPLELNTPETVYRFSAWHFVQTHPWVEGVLVWVFVILILVTLSWIITCTWNFVVSSVMNVPPIGISAGYTLSLMILTIVGII